MTTGSHEASAADLRASIELIPHFVWTATPEGSIDSVNRWATEYTGLPPEAHYGWGWVGMVHPDDAQQARGGWEHAVRTEETPAEIEYRMRRHDGEFRWHIVRGLPVRGADGRMVSWIGTATDIHDHKVLEEDLRRAEEELKRSLEELRNADEERKRLLHALLHAHEEERQLIARDLHDDTVQVVTALALQLELLATRTNDPEMLSGLSKSVQIARSTITSLRHLTFALRPPELDRDGLSTAVEIQLEQIRQEAGVQATLESDLARKLAIETSTTAYRIVQEALVNVRKHANARRIVVQLEETDDVLLGRIIDDGHGFEPSAPDPGHIGLIGMRERAEAAGGTLSITSTPTQGTRVEFALPARQASAG